jgi:hypothetical protein
MRMGNSRTLRPAAWNTAFAIADAVPTSAILSQPDSADRSPRALAACQARIDDAARAPGADHRLTRTFICIPQRAAASEWRKGFHVQGLAHHGKLSRPRP